VWGGTVGTAVAGETSVNGCIREVKEEIGIEIGEQELIFLSRIFRGNRIFDDYIVVKDIPIEKIIIKPDEVSEVKWASMDEVKSLWASGLFMINEIDDMKLVFDYIHKHFTVKT
jgi:8-oxo-dGTP pyrophosphatase MutT (NUDIX family)